MSVSQPPGQPVDPDFPSAGSTAPGRPAWPSPPGTSPAAAYPSVSYPPLGQPGTVDPTSSGADRIVFVVLAILAGIALGFIGGFGWNKVADPPQALVTDNGVFLTGEIGYDAQVTVTLWFIVVGLVGGAVSGLVVGLLGRRHGGVSVVAVTLMCAVASGLAAWSGIHVFGPDLAGQLADASPGDLVTTELSIGSDVAYLGWPIGGLLGACVGIAFWPPDRKRPSRAPTSSTVVGHSSTPGGN